jgi:hypothetical protein
MIVSQLLMFGVILGMVFLQPNQGCGSTRSFASYALDRWPGGTVKEQAIDLFLLKSHLFPKNTTLELSPQLYKFAAKWHKDRNKTLYGRQPKPKASTRWISIRPGLTQDSWHDGFILDLPLDRVQTAQVVGLLSSEQDAVMADVVSPCKQKLKPSPPPPPFRNYNAPPDPFLERRWD